MCVESIHLLEFYHGVSSWPKTQSDLATAAEKICDLLGCEQGGIPLVAVCSSVDGQEKLGVRLPVKAPTESFGLATIEEFLKRQAKQIDVSAGQPRLVQISREGLPWASLTHANFLTVILISTNIHPDLAPRDVRARKEYGWIAAVTAKPFAPKDEILLVSAAQYLAGLAAIHELESVIQLRGQFLSIASHELKTPLTSIYGLLQLQERMLRLKTDDPPEVQRERQHSFLKMVIRQVERLNELIDGLLDLSRIQNGRFIVEQTDTDVAHLLREATGARLNVISQEAGVKLNVEAPESLMAWVDPVRVEELITNLVMNAVRFSPEGGVVWIRMRDDGGALRFTVRDQGPSVPMEDRERIFQPFERAQRTSRLGGMGLGLFISRQIAQLHGGNVSLVESVPGKGNVFEAYFPMKNSNLVSATA